MSNESPVCCPKFNPEKWDKQTYVWESKKFIKDSMATFLHLPWPPTINKKITKLCQLVDGTDLADNKEEALLLFRDPSAFKSEIYLSVKGIVPNADNVTISGTFVARVFSGAYRDVPKFIGEMNTYLATTSQVATDYYIHYAYCPKCAAKYGDNYMIIFARVA